jgi:hypothetical protein
MGRAVKGQVAIGWVGTAQARMGRVGTGQAKIGWLGTGWLGTGRSGTGQSPKKLQRTLLLLTDLHLDSDVMDYGEFKYDLRKFMGLPP